MEFCPSARTVLRSLAPRNTYWRANRRKGTCQTLQLVSWDLYNPQPHPRTLPEPSRVDVPGEGYSNTMETLVSRLSPIPLIRCMLKGFATIYYYSSRNSDFCCNGPWHRQHLSASRGRILFSKKSPAREAAGRTFCAAPHWQVSEAASRSQINPVIHRESTLHMV